MNIFLYREYRVQIFRNTGDSSLYIVMKHKTINLNKNLCLEILGELEPTDITDVHKAFFARISISGYKYGMELIW
ncbi:MAG: hypothetical protein IPG53_11855 [Ignavibacteriales bacterium]|nr:hypothetical protein [Ignavibacteriales bacterium]